MLDVNLVLSIISKYKRADNVVVELKLLGLWDEIVSTIDSSKLLTTKDIEKLYVFINGYVPLCPANNHQKFGGFTVGYVFCDKASKCECLRKIVSSKVSNAKKTYNKETKDKINRKRAETNLEKYGVDNPFKDTEKIKKAYIDKFGVDNPNKLSEIREKIIATNLERYGAKAPAQNDDIKQKTKLSNLEKWGVESPMMLEEVKRRQHDTTFEKYGVYHPIQNKEILEKTKNTNILKYGYDNASKSPEIIEKIRQGQLPIFYDQLIKRLENYKVRPFDSVFDFNFIVNQTQWICDDCTLSFIGSAQNGKVPRCPTCYPQHISTGQLEVINYINSLIDKNLILVNDRVILADQDDKRKSRELDIIIPSKNIAIEYCGLRWHTEQFGKKSVKYHYQKYIDCKKVNLQLLTIFSDEWYEKKRLIKSMILTKMGMANKLYARNTTIIEISNKDAELFFTKNHLNNHIKSLINIALCYNDMIVMVMSLSKSRYNHNFEYELIRMATIYDTVVVGGASKLFNYFLKKFDPNSVISYCDLRYYTGNSYINMGFTEYLTPTFGYKYVDLNYPYQRYDRLKYQKHKLGDTGGLTEKEFMLNNGFDRIWDCGQQKFVWRKY